jgi:hypothetical protein
VISEERVERAQLHPSCAHFGVCVAKIAAYVGANVRYAEQIELEQANYVLLQMAPLGRVIAFN